MEWLKKIFEPKVWGFEAADPGGKRGKCYTLFAGIIFPISSVGMMYERDKDGNPTKDFDEVIIYKDKSHSIESYKEKNK